MKHNDDSKYVLTNKNGNVPDITLDKTSVDLLIKARKAEQTTIKLVNYILTHQKTYDVNILNDKKVVSEIITKYINRYSKTQSSIMQSIFENIISDCKAAQKYVH